MTRNNVLKNSHKRSSPQAAHMLLSTAHSPECWMHPRVVGFRCYVLICTNLELCGTPVSNDRDVLFELNLKGPKIKIDKKNLLSHSPPFGDCSFALHRPPTRARQGLLSGTITGQHSTSSPTPHSFLRVHAIVTFRSFLSRRRSKTCVIIYIYIIYM